MQTSGHSENQTPYLGASLWIFRSLTLNTYEHFIFVYCDGAQRLQLDPHCARCCTNTKSYTVLALKSLQSNKANVIRRVRGEGYNPIDKLNTQFLIYIYQLRRCCFNQQVCFTKHLSVFILVLQGGEPSQRGYLRSTSGVRVELELECEFLARNPGL